MMFSALNELDSHVIGGRLKGSRVALNCRDRDGIDVPEAADIYDVVSKWARVAVVISVISCTEVLLFPSVGLRASGLLELDFLLLVEGFGPLHLLQNDPILISSYSSLPVIISLELLGLWVVPLNPTNDASEFSDLSQTGFLQDAPLVRCLLLCLQGQH